MAAGSVRVYGYSKDLFVHRRASSDALIIGGLGEDSRWTRVLSRRAAHVLWFRLAQFLFPEKADLLTAEVGTTPLRGATLPTITTHLVVDELDCGDYEVTGRAGDQQWVFRLDEVEAARCWAALDDALFPDRPVEIQAALPSLES